MSRARSVTAVVGGLVMVLGALLAAPQPASAQQSGFLVSVRTGGVMAVLATDPAMAPFGAEEELLVRSTRGGYQVVMTGEDAQPRLTASGNCRATGSQPSREVTCEGIVTSLTIDYVILRTSTITVVTAPISTTFLGGLGNDEFYGGPGNDMVYGNWGDDVLFGDDEDGPYGDDLIVGGIGSDLIDGVGGSNEIKARDGEKDFRVQCADASIPGASGIGIWDIGLDVPINCSPVPPDQPRDFAATVGSWRNNQRIRVNFTWSQPRADAPPIDGYTLVYPTGDKQTDIAVKSLPADATSWEVDLTSSITPGRKLAILQAKGTAGGVASATVEFTIPPRLAAPAMTRVEVGTDLFETQEGLYVTWTLPRVPDALTLRGIEVERRVPAEYRSGPEWRFLADVSPKDRWFLDPCVPPGLSLDYRVRAYYLATGTDLVFTSEWRQASGMQLGFMSGKAPAPSVPDIIFTGISPEGNLPRADQSAGVRVDFNGAVPRASDCFGLAYDVDYSQRKPSSEIESNFMALGSVNPREEGKPAGADRVLNSHFRLGAGAIGQFVRARIQSRWSLDRIWQQRHGAGFNDQVLAMGMSVARLSRYISDEAQTRVPVYLSNDGATVRNLRVDWRDGLGLRVAWDAPDASNPNTVNLRGYEVCLLNVQQYVYSTDYPTLSFVRCWITAPDQRVFTPSAEDWCPAQSRFAVFYGCASYRRYMFAQVRPWVGETKAESVFPINVWSDWNRNTFVAARPS